MCGICGQYSPDGAPVDPAVLEAMTAALVHRGPDEGGTFLDGGVGLGHRRLNIIDLNAGRQPLFSEDRRLVLVLNGEIYNYLDLRRGLIERGHVFSTKTDSEVVLHLYEEKGARCLDDLRGMFAFALWDGGRRELFFARDRLGKKPLYYAWDGRRFLFGSEIKALLRAPVSRDVDPDAVFDFFQYQFIPSPRSIYRAIRKLPPAHYGIVGPEGLKIRRYWEIPIDPSIWEGRSPDEIAESVEAALEEAVRIRLMSDVPLGAFLSGGLDSSLIVALMKRAGNTTPRTFSIGFPDSSYDESRFASAVALALGTDHRRLEVNDKIGTDFQTVVSHFDEPFGDSSAFPTFHLARFTRNGVTVALSGDGGDELFGGYRRYVAWGMGRRYRRVPAAVREGVLEKAIAALPSRPGYYGRRFSKKAKLFVQASRRAEEGRPPLPQVFKEEEVRRLFPGDTFGLRGHAREDLLAEAFRTAPPLDDVTRLMWFDLHYYLPDDILVKVDRMSMFHALEVRCPFLDHRLVEMAFNLPLEYKIRGWKTKVILKKIARKYVPAAVVRRKKQGFMVPLEIWFRGELGSFLEDRVLRDSLYDRDEVSELVSGHRSGRFDRSSELWDLLTFALFNERFCL